MKASGSLPLDWLGPTLDACRGIIDRGVHDVRRKPDDNGAQIVSDVDLQVEHALISAIHTRVPSAVIVSEETSSDAQLLDDSETCFVIDPIDGTDELVAGRPGFAVSVAQFSRGRPVAAVLDFPRRGERYEGGVGVGAWLDHRRVQLQSTDQLEHARVVVSASQRRDTRLQPVWDALHDALLVPTSAFTPKFASILGGRCSVAIHLPVDDRQTHIWDYAAAAMLLVEAGGVFTTWNGQDLAQTRPLVHFGGWIAAASPGMATLFRVALEPTVSRVRIGR